MRQKRSDGARGVADTARRERALAPWMLADWTAVGGVESVDSLSGSRSGAAVALTPGAFPPGREGRSGAGVGAVADRRVRVGSLDFSRHDAEH